MLGKCSSLYITDLVYIALKVAHMYIHYICMYIYQYVQERFSIHVYTLIITISHILLLRQLCHTVQLVMFFIQNVGGVGVKHAIVYSHLHMYVHMHSARGVVLPRVNIRSIYLLPCTSCAVVGLYRMFYS